METQLVPLSRIAQRLSVRPSELVAMSRRREFPTIYSIGRVKRVDPQAVEEWLASRAETAIAEREDLAAHIARYGVLSPEVP